MDLKQVNRLVKEKCGNQILQIVLDRIRIDQELTGISNYCLQGKPLSCSNYGFNHEDPTHADHTATRSSLRQRNNKRPIKYTDYVAGDDVDGSRDSDSDSTVDTKMSKPKKSRLKSKSAKLEKTKIRRKIIKHLKPSKSKELRPEEPLPCDFCPSKFKSVKRLETHVLRYHVADKPFECEFCYRTFISKEDLQKHILRSHERESETSSVYKCTSRSCNRRTFKSKTELKQHYEVYHWSSHGGSFHNYCPLCRTDFENKTNFKKHLEIQTEEALKECTICSESIDIPCLLNQHINKKHASTQKVSDPSKKVSDPPTKVNTDTDSDGNDDLNNNFECLVCAATFSRRSDLNFHETLEKHSRWKCPLCSKLLIDVRGLKEHLRSVHCDARPLKCPDCELTFKVKRELNYHKVFHLKKTVMSKYQCSECSKVFKKPVQLLQHTGNHHGGERAFECHLCPKTWPSAPDLKQHLLSHTDERPFPCSLCEKAFKSKGERNRHLKVWCPNNPNQVRETAKKRKPSVRKKKKKPKLVLQDEEKPEPKSTSDNVDLKVEVKQENLDLDAVIKEEQVDLKVDLQENNNNCLNYVSTSTVKEESIDLKDIKQENILG